MNLYLDTSAAVKLYVSERGSAEVSRRVGHAARVFTSRVAEPEARAAFARLRREGRLTAPALRRVVSSFRRDLERYGIVEFGESVARLAGDLAERHALRAYDAIHLASAMELGHLLGAPPAFLTFDGRQGEAAAREGLDAPSD